MTTRFVRLLVAAIEDHDELLRDRVVPDREEVGERTVSRRDGEVAAEAVQADRVVMERVRRRLDLAEGRIRRQRVQRLVDVDVP